MLILSVRGPSLYVRIYTYIAYIIIRLPWLPCTCIYMLYLQVHFLSHIYYLYITLMYIPVFGCATALSILIAYSHLTCNHHVE